MTLPMHPSRMPNAVERYLAGESVFALSKSYGVDRGAVKRHLILQGVTLRAPSEQHLINNARLSPEIRKARTAAAHAASRGRSTPMETLTQRARTLELKGEPQSDAERRMMNWLEERGEKPKIQVAVGKYNIDLAIADVAVEILGAEWHRFRRGHGSRTKTILDAGWHLIFVWDTSIYPAGSGVADYAVAFAQFARRDPSMPRQYRVIWGEGDEVASGSLEGYDLARIPPPREGLTPSEVGIIGATARWHPDDRASGHAA